MLHPMWPALLTGLWTVSNEAVNRALRGAEAIHGVHGPKGHAAEAASVQAPNDGAVRRVSIDSLNKLPEK